MPRVAGFQPSRSGLHFVNSFAHVPLKSIELPLIGRTIAIGDAANGLCGGMVYAVRDYFEHGQSPPATTTSPQDGPLFDYLVQRLFESWDIPRGVLRYLELMSPGLPDYGRPSGTSLPLSASRASIMIADEWPVIRRDLDEDRLSPLGLINCKSADPLLLGRNHQVLAYGYDLDGTELTLHLYDPNRPDDDEVTLSLSLESAEQPCQIACTSAPTLQCFFRSHYSVAGPPPEGVAWAPGS
jgi:hypothetical protein